MNGGFGLSGSWKTKNCQLGPLATSARSTFTLFANRSMVSTDAPTVACGMSRRVDDSTGSNGRVFVSVVIASRSSQNPRLPSFGVAIGDVNSGEEWVAANGGGEFLTLRGTGTNQLVAFFAGQDNRTVFQFGASVDGDTPTRMMKVTQPVVNATTLFFVAKIEPVGAAHRVRFSVFDARTGGDDVDEFEAPDVQLDGVVFRKPYAISIGVASCNVVQVRVGATFNSIYSNQPSTSTTTTRPMTTSTSTSTTSTTSTTTSTSTSTVAPTTTRTTTATTPTTSSTQAQTSSASTDSMTTDSTTDSTTLSSTLPSSTADSSSDGCDSDTTTCSSCLGSESCKWCDQWRNGTAGRCIASIDTECLSLTLSAEACSSADMMDEASLPIAIIAGAAGGGVALLLLIALIVCILLRCRGDRSEKKTVAAADSPMEMVTAREGNSDSGRDTYGDLRLANNEYSSAGLSPSSGDSLSKSEATSGVSGSGGDPHYSPMAMRK